MLWLSLTAFTFLSLAPFLTAAKPIVAPDFNVAARAVDGKILSLQVCEPYSAELEPAVPFIEFGDDVANRRAINGRML